MFTYGRGPISWKSQKQRTVSLSTTEAEYMALTEAANNVIYLKEFFAEIELRYLPPITIFNDNLGAQLLSMNAIVHPRTKHIDIRYHFIRNVLMRTGAINV